MEVKRTSLYTLYLGLVSFVSVIAIAITLWVVLNSLWNYLLISDEEYIQNREYYRIEQCSVWVWDEKLKQDVIKKTPEEVKDCEEKAKKSAIISRAYNLKDMFISASAWFIVFVLVFGFHYPKFLKARKED